MYSHKIYIDEFQLPVSVDLSYQNSWGIPEKFIFRPLRIIGAFEPIKKREKERDDEERWSIILEEGRRILKYRKGPLCKDPWSTRSNLKLADRKRLLLSSSAEKRTAFLPVGQ